jgi:hypothetical protein
MAYGPGGRLPKGGRLFFVLISVSWVSFGGFVFKRSEGAPVV